MLKHGPVKNKKKKRGLAKVCIIACIFALIVPLLVRYEQKRKELHALQNWLETVLANEKSWILENQGADGEIYMNGSKAGDINPYFSCIAARGLLAETENCKIGDKEKEAVISYLNWHTRILLDTNGRMGIYRSEGKELIRVNEADSEDGYLGVYLWLMGDYLKKTGSAEGLIDWQEGISLALDRLQSLMQDGMSRVSEDNTTVYLMDNLEVWKGLYALEMSGFAETEAVTQMREGLQNKIESEFWDENNERWRTIRDSDEYDSSDFYPYAIAQISPLIYSFPAKEMKKQKALYKQFNKNFQWQELNESKNGFAWAMTGMAAAEAKDKDSLKNMIENYEEKYGNNRKYPLYTGEAGWVCMECEKLYELYDKSLNIVSPAML